MNQQEAREFLMSLEVEMKVKMGDKVYEIRHIYQEPDKTLCRTDLSLLEIGKPPTEMVQNRFLKTRMFKIYNVLVRTFYALKNSVNRIEVVN